MRFLADENFPGAGMPRWDASAYVSAVKMRGASDIAVLDGTCEAENTDDKDFGELTRKSKLPAASGVILFRVRLPAPAAAAGDHLAKLVVARQDWSGHFSVIEPGRVRMRTLA